MNSYENAIKNYQNLNSYAKAGGAALLGGTSDLNIPVGELKQSFDLDLTIYNRSVAGLTASAAADVYDACVASLRPATLILHLGEADLELFEKSASEFCRQYRALIDHVRAQNKKCDIAIVSLRGSDASTTIAAMNASLRELARVERCSFENVDDAAQSGSEAIKEAVSFVYSTGFVSQLPARTSVHNLARILYGCGAERQPALKNKDYDKKPNRLNITTVSLL